MFTIHSSVLKQVLIIIIWFVCYFYFSSLCFNYFCQVSALTKQALVYSAHLLYSEPPATQLISFEVAFVPILQRSGRARALPFVKVGLQKGRVTLAELAPCPGCQVSASCLQLFFAHFRLWWLVPLLVQRAAVRRARGARGCRGLNPRSLRWRRPRC